jgi:hypothetical protein
MNDLDPNLRTALDDLVPPEALTIRHDWDDALRRAGITTPPTRRLLRPRGRLVLVATAILVAGSSIALGARLVDGWIRDDGDRAVQGTLDQAERSAGLTPTALPGERIRVESSTGEWRVYATPVEKYGLFVTLLPPPSLGAGIFSGGFRPEGVITATGNHGRYLNASARILDVYGTVSPAVTAVEAVFPGGDRRPVPLRDGWFLYVGDPGGPIPTTLAAKDATGRIIGRVGTAQFLSEAP